MTAVSPKPVPSGSPPILAAVEEPGQGRRLARSTAFFAAATGLSRVLGLVREIVTAYFFGVTGKIFRGANGDSSNGLVYQTATVSLYPARTPP